MHQDSSKSLYKKRPIEYRSISSEAPASRLKPSTKPGSFDKDIILKKGNIRPPIHRYTLRIKIIILNSKKMNRHSYKKTLQKIFAFVLQADAKSINPPYYELDCNDKSIPDLSLAFTVEAIDSFASLKRYFCRLSARQDSGMI
jgi:hypothetical protein